MRGAGKAVVTVKAMRNIPVGRLKSQGWERLKPGGLGSEVLSSQGGREGQTSILGLLGINLNHVDTILLPSAKSGLFTPLFLRLHLNV